MGPQLAVTTERDEVVPDSAPEAPQRRPRKLLRRVLIGLGVVVALLAVAVLWFFLGREEAQQLTDDQAVADFRASGGGAAGEADAAGRPAAGVYAATASGRESLGLPGFDETYGPNAPVTITHGEDGCFDYRADLNSHHWRSWTFCPSDDATFELVQLESWTARKAPGLDLETLSTYACDRPLGFLWDGASVGDTRTGECTGTNDMDDNVTADAGEVEVLERGTFRIGGERVAAVRVRTTDTFSRSQTGSEVGTWWLDAETGLPLQVSIESSLEGGSGSYAETVELELSTLRPAT